MLQHDPDMHKMKIAHMYPVWLPVTMNWLYTLIRTTDGRVDNHVICEKMLEGNGFPYGKIHAFQEMPVWRRFLDRIRKKTGRVSSLPFYLDWMKENKPSLIHSHFGHIGANNQDIADIFNIPHVVSFYGMDVAAMPQKPGFVEKYRSMFERAGFILCEGPYMGKSIRQLGCPSEKVILHHLGIDLDRIKFLPRTYAKGERLKILIAASFRRKKGIPLALRALGSFCKNKDVHITIAGDSSADKESKREKELILETIRSQGLAGKVRLTGFVSVKELSSIAYENHIFLSPSIVADNGDCEGGAPVAIIEMAASGMLVISTTHCDIPDVIINDRTGLLAPENDAGALVDKLEWAASHPEAWVGLLRESRKHIETEFDAKKQASRLIEIYERAAKR